MSSTDEITIAEVYAQSLLELATASGMAEGINQEFGEFAAYLKIDPQFRMFITSRVIDADTRKASLDHMFRGRMSDLLLNLLQVLNDKQRLELVSHVQQQYHRLFIRQEGIVEVQVTSAEPMPDQLRGRVHRLMEMRTGSKVNLIEQVDPAVLGGLIVRTGDEQIDVSVLRQLNRFRATLIAHAEQHIHAGTDLFEGAVDY